MFSIRGRKRAGLCHTLEGGGRGGIKGEGKGRDGWVEMTILKNLSGIESWGRLSLLFVVDRRNFGRKGKHGHFPLRCVIYCDNRILTYLIL